MGKFSKKKAGELPPVSTASLPDIVFMLLFFFMVATVMRDTSLMIENRLPSADQVEKLEKDRSMFIYAGKPSAQYKNFGTEARLQINDKYASIENVQSAVQEARAGLRPELQDRLVVALKVDKNTNAGLISDVKQKLREINALKIMYITNVRKTE
ncbi:MAG: biopolymer transporter ExbD [Flavobacteriaceae bacterium]|nr:biopolymer transporter ExbD [Bacteroidia bacterium]NNL15446.1 biopolymer transporter ExbD [Flavobacteriaceae bacterium]